MLIVAIAWIYVVGMAAIVEALSPQGTVLGAVVTFTFYGVLPLSVVLYLLGTPGRKKAQRRAEAAALTALTEGTSATEAAPSSAPAGATSSAEAAPPAAAAAGAVHGAPASSQTAAAMRPEGPRPESRLNEKNLDASS